MNDLAISYINRLSINSKLFISDDAIKIRSLMTLFIKKMLLRKIVSMESNELKGKFKKTDKDQARKYCRQIIEIRHSDISESKLNEFETKIFQAKFNSDFRIERDEID